MLCKTVSLLLSLSSSDTLDAVKQSAALCLLRLIRNAPESVSMSEWSSRVIHLLNDQHMVTSQHSVRSVSVISE